MIGEAPEYLKKLHIHRPTRYLRSEADDLQLTVPRTKCKTFADTAFSVTGPLIWNSLPYDLRSCDSTIGFKKKLKTDLFRIAFKDFI